MTSPRAELVRKLFADALDRVPDERARYLDEACPDDAGLRAEVESLLTAHDGLDDFLDTPATELLEDLAQSRPPTLEPGAVVGSYEIVRTLGFGGAGTVYEAIQSSPQRRVALKVLGTGVGSPAAIERFQEEAEILARLEHPAIAHVYEAGVHAAGQRSVRYIAMELVADANTLVAFADGKRLDTRSRLQLFAHICDAVHHGHQKGIVHRDLKPENVLVNAAGQPRIVDFGIARVEGRDAAEPLLAGTASYMSPEQFEPGHDDVDVRSDVYSLGVLLFELLSGSLPRELDALPLTAVGHAVRTTAPRRLASVEPSLRGDLDAIVHKSLSVDRSDRYASAAALADDVRRHLSDIPVDAVGGGLGYQLGKLARRQRVAVTSVAALFVVAVVAAVVSSLLAFELDRQRDEAEFQAYVANIAAAYGALRTNDVAEARRRLDLAPAQHRNWEWDHLNCRVDVSARTIRWPEMVIRAGCVSESGSLVAASGRPTSPTGWQVRCWDLASGAVVFTVDTGHDRVDSLAFSPDDARLVLGFDHGRVELRDAKNGELERVVYEPASPDLTREQRQHANAIAFDPEGRRFAVAHGDGAIRIHATDDGRLVKTLTGHEDRVIALSRSADGRRLASGGREGSIRIWDFETGSELQVLHGHEESVEDVAFSPDGRRVSSVSRDRTVRFWDLAPGKVFAVGRSHGNNVRAVAHSHDGRLVATGSWDRTVRVWSASDGSELACLLGHTSMVVETVFVADPARLVSLSDDGTIKIWEIARPGAVRTLEGHRDAVLDLAFSSDGRLVASVTGAADREVRIWDVRTGDTVQTLQRPPHHGRLVAFGSEDARLVVQTQTGVMREWALHTGNVESDTPEIPPMAALDAHAERVAFATSDGAIHLRRLAATDDIAAWTRLRRGVSAIALSADGTMIAFGDGKGVVTLLRAGVEAPVAVATVHDGAVYRLRFGPAGSRLVSVGLDRTVRVLRLPDLAIDAALDGHEGRVQAAAFSPDGSRIATAGRDATVRLWDVASGRPVLVLYDHSREVRAVAFSPDGKRLATGSGAEETPGSVKIWESELPLR